MVLAEFIAQYATALIDALGYFGVFILMVLESMVFPVPSEAVMPFAGFLVANGTFTFVMVVIVSTLGSLVGSLLSYFIGRYGGRPFIDRWGKYLLLNHHDLDKTDEFFKKRGEVTIFVCRFIPVVRHLISIPAGIGEMNLFRFSVYTVLGAGLWNAFLTWLGMVLKNNWDTVMKYSQILDVLVIVVIIVGLIYFYKKHVKKG